MIPNHQRRGKLEVLVAYLVKKECTVVLGSTESTLGIRLRLQCCERDTPSSVLRVNVSCL